MPENHLSEIIKKLPTEAGIYKYLDKNGELIYVGKAKNIKKRVSSYFTKVHLDNKTRSLVRHIAHIEFMVVNSESDALLLENTLIKAHKPKYNILYKDDKSYPYIVITKERFPKIYATRRMNPDKGDYYGPFPSVSAMNTVLQLIKNLLTIRTCDLNLSENNVKKGKFKKCLEFHLGNCKAPCEGLQTEQDYLKDIEQAKQIIDGDLSLVKWYFTEQMKMHAAALDFEKAQKAKWRLEMLEKYQSHSLMVNQKTKDVYVATLKNFDAKTYVNLIKINYGRVTQSKTVELTRQMDETDEEVFQTALFDMLKGLNLSGTEILTNVKIDFDVTEAKITVPKIGDKKKLIDLSLKNIDYYRKNLLKDDEPKENPHFRILETLKNDLNLKELPTHIECFDNSNFQGTTPVAAMVCYKNGIPAKKEWRHYNIKTVTGPNDFDSMAEIVYRRYHRLLTENAPLPNLIVIDGGKGQLGAAVASLEKLGLYGKIPIISIAKRLEEIYVPGDELPVMLGKKSESLKLIQKIRDDVHRFGITFHRKKRDKIPTNKKSNK